MNDCLLNVIIDSAVLLTADWHLILELVSEWTETCIPGAYSSSDRSCKLLSHFFCLFLAIGGGGSYYNTYRIFLYVVSGFVNSNRYLAVKTTG